MMMLCCPISRQVPYTSGFRIEKSLKVKKYPNLFIYLVEWYVQKQLHYSIYILCTILNIISGLKIQEIKLVCHLRTQG